VRLEGQKQREMSMSIPVIEQAKIQAQVLVPLIKAMQAELGEARANALVRKALGEIYRRYGEKFWRAKREENLGNSLASAFAQFARGDAIDYRGFTAEVGVACAGHHASFDKRRAVELIWADGGNHDARAFSHGAKRGGIGRICNDE
jgi:hypothetical protein